MGTMINFKNVNKQYGEGESLQLENVSLIKDIV